MTDDNTEMQWKYDFAWKVRDIAQEANDRLDTKAMNIINFSSIIIPIVTGILLLYFGKQSFSSALRFFWFVSLILLLLSIFFAFRVIWLRDQGMINISNHFSKCKDDEISKILEYTANDIASWQNVILNTKKDKNLNFRISSYCFIAALATIAISSPFFIL